MNESLALTPAPWPALSNVEVCNRAFFNISSYGTLENYEAPSVIFGYALPLLELQILIIFVLIVLSHMFLRFIGVPQFVSYMFVSDNTPILDFKSYNLVISCVASNMFLVFLIRRGCFWDVTYLIFRTFLPTVYR